MLPGERRSSLEIADLEQRVRHRFDVDSPGIGTQLRLPRIGIVAVDEIKLESKRSKVFGEKIVSPSVQAVLRQQMIAGGQEGQQRGGDRSHSARGDQCRFSVFERRKFSVERQMIGTIVEPDVSDVVVALLAGVFEHGRLEDRQAHRSEDSRLGFAGVDQLRFDAFELFHR